MIETEAISCPVCSGTGHRALFTATDRLHGVPGGFAYVECSACGLVYMNPRVVKSAIKELYPSDYAPHEKSSPPAAGGWAPRGLLARAAAAFDFFLRNEKLEPSVSGPLGPASRVLDVGCGNGRFLAGVAADYGCQVEGVDMSPLAVASARESFGVGVFQGILEEAAFPDGSFDVVTSWWYLEHVPDPVASLREMRRILKPGGACVFGVPNAGSRLARLFGRRWYHLDCPRHLQLFTPRSMAVLLKNAGLVPDKIAFDKTPWGLIGSLAYCAGGTGDAPRRWRRKAWLRLGLLPFTLALGLAGQGDTMVVLARKPSGKAE
jgi:SAM-dependent methyltransferase